MSTDDKDVDTTNHGPMHSTRIAHISAVKITCSSLSFVSHVTRTEREQRLTFSVHVPMNDA